MIRPTLANEPDRDRRERLERVRVEIVEEQLNPIHLEAAQVEQRAVRELGAPTYVDLYRKFGFDLDALAEQCRAFLDSTERLYEETADQLFRERVGVGLSEVKRWDVARLFRAAAWDEAFPKELMLPALEATLSDLGIDLRAQENVHLDIEERPRKTPRAFCAPIEVPDRVMLVIQPIGGPVDWRALFHEAGHTEYCAKLLYEREFHAADDVTELSGRYVELLGDALKIEPSPVDYLSDIDPGFYVTAYLRSWAFEAQMRTFLRERFGRTW